MSGQSKNLLAVLGMLAIAGTALAGSLLYQWHKNRLAGLPEASLGWPSVSGLIVRSTLDVRTSILRSRRRVHNVRVVYEYVVDARSYRNDVVRFDQAEISLAEKEAIVSSHPVGRTVPVYYNPEKPGQSVLLREAGER